jgi:hypothetical protein
MNYENILEDIMLHKKCLDEIVDRTVPANLYEKGFRLSRGDLFVISVEEYRTLDEANKKDGIETPDFIKSSPLIGEGQAYIINGDYNPLENYKGDMKHAYDSN